VNTLPLLEPGQSVLVGPTADDAPWRMTVDLVQEGHVTLATVDDEHLPLSWRDLGEVHMTLLDRYNVHLIHVPVVRVGTTRLVVGAPDDTTPVQRRAYARIFSPVPVSCTLLDASTNQWMPFTFEIRDMGGGGCSALADAAAPDGATVVISFALDDLGPIVVIGRVLPREVVSTIGRHLIRIEFVLVREPERDRILRYILLTSAARRHRPNLQPS
jgi:hypothetical protein